MWGPAAEALPLEAEDAKRAPTRGQRTGLQRALTAQGSEFRGLQGSPGWPGQRPERAAGRVPAPAPAPLQDLAPRLSHRCWREQKRV